VKVNIKRFLSYAIISAYMGYFIAGVAGAIFGVLVGFFAAHILPERKTTYSDLIDKKVLAAITKLSMIIMKADGYITNSELYIFRDFMYQNFGSEATADAIDILKEIQYKKNLSQDATYVINDKLNYSEKMQILQFLFQLAAADREMQSSKFEILNKIAQEIHILQTDFIYIKNAYNHLYNRRYSKQDNQYSSVRKNSPVENDYAILGVKSSDSSEEIKAAYRRLAIANHPDKVLHLGETAHKEAEKRFGKINEAYTRIKKARKI